MEVLAEVPLNHHTFGASCMNRDDVTFSCWYKYIYIYIYLYIYIYTYMQRSGSSGRCLRSVPMVGYLHKGFQQGSVSK